MKLFMVSLLILGCCSTCCWGFNGNRIDQIGSDTEGAKTEMDYGLGFHNVTSFHDFLIHQTLDPNHSPRNNEDIMNGDESKRLADDAHVLNGSGQEDDVIELISSNINNSLGTLSAINSRSYSCGTTPYDRIVGGSETKVNAFPWQVALELDWGLHFCGGSLINENYVLTAAHCVAWGRQALKMVVKIGDHHLGESEESMSIKRYVRRLKYHRRYNTATTNYDIALIQLSEPVPFTASIGPVCLPDPKVDYQGTSAIVTGWGHTKYGGRGSQILRQVNVNVISNNQCSDLYRSSEITPQMLCAGDSNGGRDACQGDSGGPLVSNAKSDKYVQIGVVSWGKGCGFAEYPGVYADVAYFRDWILRHSR